MGSSGGLVMYTAGQLLLPDGSAAAPSYAFAAQPAKGLFYDAVYGVTIVGTTNYPVPTFSVRNPVSQNASITLVGTDRSATITTAATAVGVGVVRLEVTSDTGPHLMLVNGNNTVTYTTLVGVAGGLDQRNGVNPQTFRLYNTYADASNYERLSIGWMANELVIKNENLGTGTPRDIAIKPLANFKFGGGAGVQWMVGGGDGQLQPINDNVSDLGTAAARPRTVYAATSIIHSAAFATNAGVRLNSAAYLYSGAGVPANATGNDGDLYFRTDGGAGTTIYQRRVGVWVATGA